MAKADKYATDSPKELAPASGSGMKALLVMAAIGFISGATGFAVPMVFLNRPNLFDRNSFKRSESHRTNGKSDQHSAKHDATKNVANHDMGGNQPAFVPFGEVVVNLAEERMTRYLRITLTLQVEPANEELVKRAVEKKKTILKNWLIGYLSDKELDEVRGAVGVNKARREIQEQFNRLLFPDSSDLIQDILFEDFTVT